MVSCYTGTGFYSQTVSAEKKQGIAVAGEDVLVENGPCVNTDRCFAQTNRRVTRAAEASDAEVDADSTYPHALRATCASHWAAKQIDIVSLKSMMGWASYQTAENYLAESGKRTEKALRQL